MKAFEHYFRKHSPVFPEFSGNLSIIVIIPVYDEPDIGWTLCSLLQTSRQNIQVGVILVVNHAVDCAEKVKETNRKTLEMLKVFAAQHREAGFEFYIIEALDLPPRESGVGVARKMGMDVAAWYFFQQRRPEGIIVSLDADARVQDNYFTELYTCFACSDYAGVSVYYEHPLGQVEGPQREAMIKYELYLRYYCWGLKWIGHPYAFSCIGSAFAVRARDYAAQGGMNKRQAGEDFYFLQKLIATRRYARLSTTTVYPSPRLSNRTPFGTGQAVGQITAEGGAFFTYHIEAFRVLRDFFAGVDDFYQRKTDEVKKKVEQQPVYLQRFLSSWNFVEVVEEVNANTASLPLFCKRFFDNFNAFRVLKFLNSVHPEIFPRQEIFAAVSMLFSELGWELPETPEEALLYMRKLRF